MNLFDIYYRFDCKKIDVGIRVFKSIFTTALPELETAVKNAPKIVEGLQKLPEAAQKASVKWAEYRWVPCLPGYDGIDMMSAIFCPETQEDADKEMMDKLDQEKLNDLFSELRKYIADGEHNGITLEDAVKCFENEIYTGCSLCLFALIDSCFVKGQPKPKGKNQRALACQAVKNAIDNEKSGLFVISQTTKMMVEDVFRHGGDFNPHNEIGLKRSFVSHGMNKYNPNRTDCVKLFVLLYNVHLMFEAGIFRWSKEEINVSCVD